MAFNRTSLFFIAVLMLCLVSWIFFTNKKHAPKNDENPTIETTVVREVMWSPRLNMIGSTVAEHSVDISSAVPGKVNQILFESGQRVRKGDVLVILDYAIWQAMLEEVQAKIQFQKSNVRRHQYLYERGIIPKVALETLQSDVLQEQARSREYEAEIQERIIKAPFDGILGVKQVDVGQYFQAGQRIITLQKINPLFIDFKVPQEEIKQVFKGQLMELALPGTQNLYQGIVIMSDNRIDSNSRTMLFRAKLNNDDGKFIPGMFVSLSLMAGNAHKVISIPKTAINYSLKGASVFTMKEGKINTRFIDIIQNSDDGVIVHGLQKNEIIVTAGQAKLYDGMSVNIEKS